MKLGYEKLMEENDIEEKSLPKDLILAIRELKALKGNIQAKRNIGQAPSPETMSKLRFKDKLIINELLEYLDDEEDEDEDIHQQHRKITNDEDDLEDHSEDEDDPEDDSEDDSEDEEDFIEDPNGTQIDSELNNLINSGKSTITFSELKSLAPSCEKIIFSNYESNSKNGIVTTNFSIIETAPNSEKFNVTKIN
jgi:hypothetical protein